MVDTEEIDRFLDPEVYGDAIADIYDELHSGPDRREATYAAADFLHARAGAGHALELGIGTGRVALPLAARGTKVVGIDASPRMLEKLRDKPGASGLELRLGDFGDLDLPGGHFSLVYVVFSTFCGLPDQEAQVRCFAAVAAALRPGGQFVVEAFVPDPTRFGRGQRVDVDRFTEDATHLNAAVHDPVAQRIRNRRLVLGPDGVRNYPVDLRYAWPSELDLMGRLAGLEFAERWGGWSGEPFTAASATHISIWRKSPVIR
ncbi:class I SAM-dependent methyltransferase [Frankia sp. AiPa1]|uniref:class I SAM-dependent DNA methyltransferase n=1 Tax=Frankia sp. AiPa1 TaxID=573492 RepID=UPI00202AC69F|nr:class I SAM-dependent methyltransferase [Frankia sp. AiPa1]MCL9758189.1 class I SAM-dependent methyltransferase [Frankia sp. AiPa1]